jgi:hypothetical protein
MELIDENKYNELKYILSGCYTYTDAIFISELYLKNNPNLKIIIQQIIDGKKYMGQYDYKVFMKIFERYNNITSYSDILQNINELYKSDDLYYKTIIRLLKYKKDKIELSKDENNDNILKKCPHCGIPNSGSCKTIYMICGYGDLKDGFDWKGCGKDWCFVCGKMLCKKWLDDKLFCEPNKIHDSICCLQHANNNNQNYLTDYCQCSHKYVHRNK